VTIGLGVNAVADPHAVGDVTTRDALGNAEPSGELGGGKCPGGLQQREGLEAPIGGAHRPRIRLHT
jgi:hypothetical protein